MKSVLETLEYDKLKDIIAKFIQTAYGKKALKQLTPEFDIDKAKREFEILNEFFDFFYRWGSISLDDINISDIIKDSFNSRLSEKELFQVGNFLSMLKEIEVYFSEHDSDIDTKYIYFDIPQDLLDEIIVSIDNHGYIKDTATSYLFEITTQIRQLKDDISRSLKNLMHSRAKDAISDTAIFLKRSRYTLLMKPNYKEYINGRTIDISKSGGLFVEPDFIYEKNNTLEELILKEEAEKRRILFNLTNLVRKNSSRLIHNERRLGYLDLQIAKFEYAKQFEMGDIAFTNKPILLAKDIKHPILSHINNNTKSVDILLKDDNKLIITGPNTGGKTVFLKTIGLSVLSIFSNIPPVAASIEIGNFDGVYAVIGDQQNILESLSSFSAKMIAVKEIMDKISNNSLVLLDEIGSGTSPDEGEAVAYSIIKNLTNRCSFVVTTHYKRLAYILSSKQYKTAAFEFNEKTLKPTYRLMYSKVGESYAMEILKTLGMQKAIIDIAVEFYKNNETQFSKLEKELETSLNNLLEEKKYIEQLKFKYEKLIEEERINKEQLLQQLNQEQERRKAEYENLINDIKNELNRLLKEKNVSQAHKKINSIKNKAQTLFKSDNNSNQHSTAFKVSDKVIFNANKGVIISIKGKRAAIEINGKAIDVPLSSLTKIESQEKKEKAVSIKTPNKFESLELNIIGKRRDEAQMELARFIDSLITESIKTARIVHGIGSGILRAMVQEFLKAHPYVKSFRSAHPNEGGDGATIVEFK